MKRVTFTDRQSWIDAATALGYTVGYQGQGSALAYRRVNEFHIGAWRGLADCTANQNPEGWLYAPEDQAEVQQ